MARLSSTAATDESTPPLTAPITLPVGPTFSRTCVHAHKAAQDHDASVKAAQNKIPPEPMATTIKPVYASLFFMVFM